MQKYLDFALNAITTIRPLLTDNFGKPDHIELKKDGTVVTNIDPECERIIREMIHNEFPDHAIKGGGAFKNNKQIKITDCTDNEIKTGIIAMSSRNQYERSGYSEQYDKVFKEHPNSSTIPNCYGHGLVAEGALSAMTNFDISLWDIAATQLIIEEAGGKFIAQKRDEKFDIIFGKPKVVDWLLAEFQIKG